MASIKVTFSNATAASYDVVITTHSGTTTVGGPKDVPAEGGDVSYDDSHGENYIAKDKASGRSSDLFYRGQREVNIPL